ncbi:MAG: hypothetical protein OFPI_44730 [Osedax symbiont Rs2]|nr:MAG: hypothetical protein OFPI_44730 [Osedax symbiont Rs2]
MLERQSSTRLLPGQLKEQKRAGRRSLSCVLQQQFCKNPTPTDKTYGTLFLLCSLSSLLSIWMIYVAVFAIQ